MFETYYPYNLSFWGGWKKPSPDSEDPKIYEGNDEKGYADKGDHKKRTLGNETERKGGHKDHWKKEEKKKKSTETKDEET